MSAVRLDEKMFAIFTAGYALATAQQNLRPEEEIKILLHRLECLLHEYGGLLAQKGLQHRHDLPCVSDYRGWAMLAANLRYMSGNDGSAMISNMASTFQCSPASQAPTTPSMPA